MNELQHAKKKLKAVKFLKISREGMPSKTFYDIDYDMFETTLGIVIQQIGDNPNKIGDIPRHDCGNSPVLIAGFSQSITETTSETTTKKEPPISPKGESVLEIPEEYSQDMKQVLSDWLEYKQDGKRKQPYKPVGWKALLTTVKASIDKHGEDAVIDQINTAMASGWKGMTLQGIKDKPVEDIPEDIRRANEWLAAGGDY